MIAGLIVVILVNGLGFFWPSPLDARDAQGRQRVPGRAGAPRADPEPRPAGPPEAPPRPAQGRQPRPAAASTSSGSTRTTIAAREQPAGRLPGRAAGVRAAPRHARRWSSRASARSRREPEAIGRALPAAAGAGRPRPGRHRSTSRRTRSATINYRIEQARLERAARLRKRQDPVATRAERPSRAAIAEQQALRSRSRRSWRRLMATAGATVVTFRAADGAGEGAARRSTSTARTPPTSSAGVSALGDLRSAGCGSS